MEDKASAMSRHIRGWRASVKKGEAQRVMTETVALASKRGADVLILKADMVFGLDHIKAAYCHAKEAIDDGRGASDSITMETLLYASGERQLGSAIKKMSVDQRTEEIVVVLLGGEGFEPSPGWAPLPDHDPGPSVGRLKSFGISENELGTVAPGKEGELVLERVASVDVMKK